MAGAALNFCMDDANFKAEREKMKENKEIFFGAKPTVLRLHASYHQLNSVEIFQTLH